MPNGAAAVVAVEERRADDIAKVDAGADTSSAGGTAELVKCSYSESARSCQTLPLRNRLYIERLPTNPAVMRVHRPSNRGFRANSNIPFGLHSIYSNIQGDFLAIE